MATTATTHLWHKSEGEFPAKADRELVETLMVAKRNGEARLTIVWAMGEEEANDEDFITEPVVEVNDSGTLKTKTGESSCKSLWTVDELLRFNASIRFAFL